MTDEEIITVVSAHKEGKKIECKMPSGEKWWPMDGATRWDFHNYDYRVAPEPRKEWWLDFKDGGRSAQVYSFNYCGDCVHVEEVKGTTSVKRDFDWNTVKTSQETEPRKPREWWIDEYVGGTIHVSKHPPSLEDMKCAHAYSKTYHAREVLE